MIGVNAVFVQPGRVGGAEQMAYNLVDGLLAGADARVTLFVGRGVRVPDERTAPWRAAGGRERFAVASVAGKGPRFVAETLALPGAMRRAGVRGAIFPNYFTPPRRFGFPVATVIHDLLYAHHPAVFSARKRRWLRMAHRLTLGRADRVVFTSRFVRDDALRAYGGAHEEKFRVIPIPVSWERFAPGPGGAAWEPADARPYVLSVAAHYPHKNLRTLVRAFALLAERLPDHRLVLAGQLRENLVGLSDAAAGPGIGALIGELGLAGRVEVTGHVDDAQLGELYRGASLFVFPSLFEGFGMPPVEALGMGIPTLTTRCASIPEVTLGKAWYVDRPTDPAEMADQILAMLLAGRGAAPTAADVAEIRRWYAPERIAREYLAALG